MVLLLAFALTLTAAVLLSALAHRSVLSTAVLFLLVGVVIGDKSLGVLHLDPTDTIVGELAKLALFSVLFTDGMRAPLHRLAHGWRLPGRALGIGMPLTIIFTALAGRTLADLSWTQAWLLAAVLSPTDPVFAAAIVGREGVPARLRHMLNVESGVNDGLALPIVIVLLSVMEPGATAGIQLVGELAAGAAIGVVIPFVVLRLARMRVFGVATRYEPLTAFAIGLVILSVAELAGFNLFLAAFTGGVTVATVDPQACSAFGSFGELLTELLKLAAVLVFGALLSLEFLSTIPIGGYVFAVLVLFAIRPTAIATALVGTSLDRRERSAAAWFGPRGFASVTYGLLVLSQDVPGAATIFHLTALVVAASIVVHSTSDVTVARAFRRRDAKIDQPPREEQPTLPIREHDGRVSTRARS